MCLAAEEAGARLVNLGCAAERAEGPSGRGCGSRLPARCREQRCDSPRDACAGRGSVFNPLPNSAPPTASG